MCRGMSKRLILLVMIGSMGMTTIAGASEIKKEESVYVNLDSSGNVEKKTVTNWIHSDKGNIDVEDETSLKNIENIKNIKFKIIVLNKGIDNKNIKNILLNAEYLILNSDINVKIDLIENLDLKVITYGFNSKSTVTASSVTEEEMLICVQRNIINIKGKKIEPQEINIEKDIMLDNYDNMYIMCLAIIYGKM